MLEYWRAGLGECKGNIIVNTCGDQRNLNPRIKNFDLKENWFNDLVECRDIYR